MFTAKNIEAIISLFPGVYTKSGKSPLCYDSNFGSCISAEWPQPQLPGQLHGGPTLQGEQERVREESEGLCWAVMVRRLRPPRAAPNLNKSSTKNVTAIMNINLATLFFLLLQQQQQKICLSWSKGEGGLEDLA